MLYKTKAKQFSVPSTDNVPIFDSRKSNSVLGPDGLPPASSSSSCLERPLPRPFPVREQINRHIKKDKQAKWQ